MENVILHNGVKMPILGFGTAGIKDVDTIKNAINIGYRLLDSAKMYENEEILGKVIADKYIDRKELFITTKLFRSSYSESKQHIEDSLRKLNTDYIDLLLVHEPYFQSYDMYEAIKEAYSSGKARSIGVSNFNEVCYEEFIKKCGIVPMVNQVECHAYFNRNRLRDKLNFNNTKTQAWSPIVAGKKDLFEDSVMISLSEKYEKTIPQIALRYLVQNGISAVPKSSLIHRIKENFDIFDFSISDYDIDLIHSLDKGVSTTNWYRNNWF